MFFDDSADQTGPIMGFNGPFRFLSNFWPVLIRDDQLTFASVEHAYQAGKFTDRNIKKLFSTENKLTAGQAKRLGRQFPIGDHHEKIKKNHMLALVGQKFFVDLDLRQQLVETAPRHIFELNNWGDEFWGVTQDAQGRLKGENWLGRFLMSV